MLAGETGVVEGCPLLDGRREVVTGVGVAHLPDVGGQIRELCLLLGVEKRFGCSAEALGCRLGVSPRVDEHQRRPTLLECVPDNRGRLALTSPDREL